MPAWRHGSDLARRFRWYTWVNIRDMTRRSPLSATYKRKFRGPSSCRNRLQLVRGDYHEVQVVLFICFDHGCGLRPQWELDSKFISERTACFVPAVCWRDRIAGKADRSSAVSSQLR